MKISFVGTHPIWGGLDNGGGSRTIIRSSQVLEALGHRTCIVTESDRHTWIRHKRPVSRIPYSTDVAIAISVSDIKPMMKELKRRENVKQAVWLRGWEAWRMPSTHIKRILKRFFQAGGTILVNSSWLRDKLWKNNIYSTILYQGFDIDSWQDLKLREKEDKIVIGCLYNKTHATKRWDLFEKLPGMLGFKAYKYCAFGAHKESPNFWLKSYRDNPTHEQLQELYSQCHIWFAPTEKEGLHNVPAEANLCGALVMHNTSPANGILDYGGEDVAMVYSDCSGIIPLIQNADFSKVPKMQAKIREKIGTREERMNQLVEMFREAKT